MWVKHLTLTNFRGFEMLELDLDRPLTVLVGVNGSGKSSVLRAIVVGVSRLCGGSGLALDARDVRRGGAEAIVKVELRQGSSRRWWVQRFPRALESGGDNFGDQSFFSEIAKHRPFAFLVSTERMLTTATLQPTSEGGGVDEDAGTVSSRVGYARFIEWFKEREDVENERRVAVRDFNVQDPQLRAVREAVAALMPGFENLRIQRDPAPAMVVTKDGVELRLDQLSDGERNLVALAGDLARRMVIADPSSEAPRETEGVILIDEVEQHLHPAWQRRVIPALRRAFPRAQLIVTTHSPQVLSSVPASSIVLLDSFSALPVTAATEGRDTNAILREVFGVPERPQPQLDEVRAIRALIDDDRLDEARARLDELAAALSEADHDVVALRMRMHVAEAAE